MTWTTFSARTVENEHSIARVGTVIQTWEAIMSRRNLGSFADRPIAAADLDWTVSALGRDIAGVTALTVDDAGMYTSVAIHYRPLGAVLAFSQEMNKRLDGLIEPGHFADERLYPLSQGGLRALVAIEGGKQKTRVNKRYRNPRTSSLTGVATGTPSSPTPPMPSSRLRASGS
jgi:hypothetical protein